MPRAAPAAWVRESGADLACRPRPGARTDGLNPRRRGLNHLRAVPTYSRTTTLRPGNVFDTLQGPRQQAGNSFVCRRYAGIYRKKLPVTDRSSSASGIVGVEAALSELVRWLHYRYSRNTSLVDLERAATRFTAESRTRSRSQTARYSMASAGKKAAATRKRRAAAKKAATTRKRRAAGRKAAGTRKRRAAGAKAATTRRRRSAAKKAAATRAARKPAVKNSIANIR